MIRDLPNVPGARGVHRLGEGGSVRYDTNLLSLNPARGSGGVSGFPGSTGYPGSGSQPGPRFSPGQQGAYGSQGTAQDGSQGGYGDNGTLTQH